MLIMPEIMLPHRTVKHDSDFYHVGTARKRCVNMKQLFFDRHPLVKCIYLLLTIDIFPLLYLSLGMVNITDKMPTSSSTDQTTSSMQIDNYIYQL